MTQETSQTSNAQNATDASGVRVERLSSRAIWGLIGVVLVTVAALWMAWRWPDHTSWHFWLVTQLVPVVYGVLAWWGVDRSSAHDSDVV